uniref:Interferon stimulated exonuclease 20 like 2 n=2 Tax=root TaxID=1 RepID=A0A674HE87_TAEGU|nr:interferon-stimulated 20 kDa exonuclease-like 2 [Taeniopygia guttata]
MDDLILNVDFGAPEPRPQKEPGNRKHQRFVRRRRELERRGVLRQKQLPAKPGQRSRPKPRRCPKENGTTGATTTGKARGAGAGGAPPVSQPQKGRGAGAGGAPPVSQPRKAPGAGAGGAAPVSQPRKGRGAGAGGVPPVSQPRKARGAAPGAPPVPPKLVAMDCEMVGTGPGGRTSALARCSIVSYGGDVMYDRYVRPEAPIVDYRTRWSGIRRQHMDSAVPFRRAQREVLRLLAGKVVVGHAIHNDFKALRYCHPRALTRDTAQIPLLNRRAGFPENVAVSLKRLTKALLNQDIQVGKSGHSSVEDARATMELYKLVEDEWEQHLQQNPEQK